MSRFDNIAERHGTVSEKYNKDLIELFCGNREAEPFWVADMDFHTPEVILEALRTELSTGVLGYVGSRGLISAFSSFVQERHSWQVDPSLTVIAPGMLASIALLLDIYTRPGDPVLLPFPAYKPFVSILNRLERRIIPLHLSYDEHTATFSFPLETYTKVMRENSPRALLFCSPHNPTGMVFSSGTLRAVAEVAQEVDALVISDEIHCDLVYRGEVHTPFNRVSSGMELRSATCMAPSKTFNMAGEHFSMVVCSDRSMKQDLVRKLESIHVGPDYLAVTAARAAYQEGLPWLQELIPYLESNLDSIEELLHIRGSSMRLIRPSASFIALLDCTALLSLLRTSGREEFAPAKEAGYLSRFFGVEAGIAVNDGSWFGSGYENFVRFNYASSRERVISAILAMIDAEKRLIR